MLISLKKHLSPHLQGEHSARSSQEDSVISIADLDFLNMNFESTSDHFQNLNHNLDGKNQGNDSNLNSTNLDDEIENIELKKTYNESVITRNLMTHN